MRTPLKLLFVVVGVVVECCLFICFVDVHDDALAVFHFPLRWSRILVLEVESWMLLPWRLRGTLHELATLQNYSLALLKLKL